MLKEISRYPAFCLLLIALPPVTARAGVVIEGTVTLPSVRATTPAARYQQISGTVAEPEPPTAVVYLDGSFPGVKHVDREALEVAQQGYQFAPGLLAVQQGTEVAFPNKDDDYHHVFSYSKSKSFDLGRYRMGEEAPRITFDVGGAVTVGCEIHDHMRGTILVLETPYFTRTDSAGKYRLEIPEAVSGAFTLRAWISPRQVFGQPVQLEDGATLNIDFADK